MIHDAKVEVTCDHDGCTDNVFIEPDYVYRTMSENSGYYDTSDKAIHEKLEAEGWFVQDDKTFCQNHEPEDSESEDEEDDDE